MNAKLQAARVELDKAKKALRKARGSYGKINVRKAERDYEYWLVKVFLLWQKEEQ